MSRKGGGLPDIEDATFLACLDPLAGTLAATAPRYGLGGAADPPRAPVQPVPFQARSPANRAPNAARGEMMLPQRSADTPALPSLAAWRTQADEEYAELRAVDHLLAASDAELAAAWQTYPRQILGFLERISRMRQRRAAQDQAMATILARIHTTMLQAAAEAPPSEPVQRQRPTLV